MMETCRMYRCTVASKEFYHTKRQVLLHQVSRAWHVPSAALGLEVPRQQAGGRPSQQRTLSVGDIAAKMGTSRPASPCWIAAKPSRNIRAVRTRTGRLSIPSSLSSSAACMQGRLWEDAPLSAQCDERTRGSSISTQQSFLCPPHRTLLCTVSS